MNTKEAEEAQKAFNEGLIFAYDWSEADINSKVFKNNQETAELCKEQLKEWFFQEEEEPPLDEEDFRDFLENLVFYVYTGKSKPKSLNEAVRLTTGKSFWKPQYVWIKGKMYDTYNMPATDKKGTITGIRL